MSTKKLWISFIVGIGFLFRPASLLFLLPNYPAWLSDQIKKDICGYSFVYFILYDAKMSLHLFPDLVYRHFTEPYDLFFNNRELKTFPLNSIKVNYMDMCTCEDVAAYQGYRFIQHCHNKGVWTFVNVNYSCFESIKNKSYCFFIVKYSI